MELEQLKSQYPADATIRNCLAWAHISRGDIKAYAREYRALAALRGVPEMKRLSTQLDAAIERNPATAHLVLVAEARRDRATLVILLEQAATLGERWYSATLNKRIAEKWRGDAEVQRLLRKVVIATPRVDLS